KSGILAHSEFLDGLSVPEAISKMISHLEEHGLGFGEEMYRLRDANFSRQRYWGEPFPIYYEQGIPQALAASDLPVCLPEMDDFRPTGSPESPLVKAEAWVNLPDGSLRETDTMPGYAGSSWY